MREREPPEGIVTDNYGLEFTGRVLAEWAYQHAVKLHFMEPGKPTQNAYIESSNGKFRDQCPNANEFVPLADARKRDRAVAHRVQSRATILEPRLSACRGVRQY